MRVIAARCAAVRHLTLSFTRIWRKTDHSIASWHLYQFLASSEASWGAKDPDLPAFLHSTADFQGLLSIGPASKARFGFS